MNQSKRLEELIIKLGETFPGDTTDYLLSVASGDSGVVEKCMRLNNVASLELMTPCMNQQEVVALKSFVYDVTQVGYQAVH